MESLLTEEQERLLANPFWNALQTKHSVFAEHMGGALRYPVDVLPFATIETEGSYVDWDLLRRDSDVNFVGQLPPVSPSTPGLFVGAVLQMIFPNHTAFSVPGPIAGETELGEADADAMLELTSVAFPGYFRRQTPQLGRYIGIRENGRLVAMAGERLRLPGFREISAVCTRPGFTGKGYAQHLIQRMLSGAADEVPFLHVISVNKRAIGIYEELGFVNVGRRPLIKLPQL